MNEAITKLFGFVENITIHESLAALLRDRMKTPLEQISRSRNYFRVTELSNPAQCYWDRLNPGIKKSAELRRKLAKGTKLHKAALHWFMALPDFTLTEGLLDGVWVGIDKVRGQLDYRIGDSLIEFKTKDEIPMTPEEVFAYYPNDLEQLIFYYLIHPSNPEINYLVFMKDSGPRNMAVFKVVMRNKGKLKGIIHKRIADIERALENKDPSRLGRCRYYGRRCQFQENNLCNCESLSEIQLDVIKDSISLTFDVEFTKKLEAIRDSSKPRNYYSSWDIISPRKYYIKMIEEIEEQKLDNLKREDYEACLWASVKSLPIELNHMERQQVHKSKKDFRISTKFNWAKKKSSINPNEIVPFVLKVSNASKKESTLSPSMFYIADLAVTCAAYGKSSGLIFVLYPNQNKFVQVFDVNFKNPDGMLKEVKLIIEKLERVEKDKDILSLHSCPDFINKDRSCPMTDICHSREGSGCIKGLIIKTKSPIEAKTS